MQSQLLDVLSTLAKSDAGMNELFQAKSKKEIISVLYKHGYEPTEQELDAFMKQFTSEDEELDESLLEAVTGGNTSNAWKTLRVIIPHFVKR